MFDLLIQSGPSYERYVVLVELGEVSLTRKLVVEHHACEAITIAILADGLDYLPHRLTRGSVRVYLRTHGLGGETLQTQWVGMFPISNQPT
ncbi:hypothetical protein Mhypo_03526 [Meiothermus hypogaeus]|uniref:Uncharacterized protein n=1 Tax=Meiothermus hypogaeus TaxID=884155 RepID=A0ABX9MGU5_9DEIN|nr:hypothetical protein Mhypo_03526 [Meiothermus hypogaeus]